MLHQTLSSKAQFIFALRAKRLKTHYARDPHLAIPAHRTNTERRANTITPLLALLTPCLRRFVARPTSMTLTKKKPLEEMPVVTYVIDTPFPLDYS